MDYEYQYQTDYSGMDVTGHDAAALAFMAGFMGFMLLIAVAFYVYLAVCLMKIAKRTGTPNAWFAWIPILNVILMIQIARRPIWWLIMFFIPGVNIIFTILVWMEIAKAVGKPEWWGILMIVPVVNLVVPGYLAFSSDVIVQSKQPQQEVAQNDQPAPEPKTQATEKPEVIKEDVSMSSDDDGGGGD